MRVILSPEAEQDIKDIAASVAMRASRAVARKVVDRIKAQIRFLKEFPGAGHVRGDLPAHIRATSAYSYVILHRLENNAVIILRVVHGARNIGPDMVS